MSQVKVSGAAGFADFEGEVVVPDTLGVGVVIVKADFEGKEEIYAIRSKHVQELHDS